MDRARDILLITLIAGVIFFFNLGASKLWDRDEPRNAGCAKEMLARGNYVTPIFNGELRDAKPVLLYWFIMSAYQVFGVNEFAARFWSAALALGTVLCTYFIAQRFFSRRVGVLAAVALSTSLMFDVAARAATPDSLLIFFSTAALTVFTAFAFPKNSKTTKVLPSSNTTRGFPRSLPMALAIYGLMGLGVLAKGPIAFLMPTAIIGMYLLIVTAKPIETSEVPSGELNAGTAARVWSKLTGWLRVFHPVHFLKTCWSMRLLLAAAVIVVVAGPWYFLVGLETEGSFLKTFFLKEHLGRTTTSFENHSGGIFYYPIVLSLGFFPWSVFALPVFVSLYSMRKSMSPQIIFLLCWVGVQVSVFTIVQTKLPSYVTPCYPALAIAVSYFLNAWVTHEIQLNNWIPRISFITLSVAGVGMMIGIGFAASKLLNMGPEIAWIGMVPACGGMILLGLWNHELHQSFRGKSALFTVALTAILFSTLFFGVILPQVSRSQTYDQLLSNTIKDSSPLGSFGCLEPSWVFYGDRTVYELVAEPNRDDQSVIRADDEWRPKSHPSLKTFLVSKNGKVITLARLIPEIEASIGGNVRILAETSYFMKEEQLVLIEAGRDSVAEQPTRRSWK